MKRGQSAIEFVLLTGVMFLLFGITIISLQKALLDSTTLTKQRTLDEIEQVIVEELATAERMPAGYERRFTLPASVQGYTYTATVHTENPPLRDELILRLLGEERVVYLPQNVMGSLQPGENTLEKNSNFIGLNAYPIAYWKLDEGAGSEAEDTASGKYNGTLQGSASWAVANGHIYAVALDTSGADGDEVLAPFPDELSADSSWTVSFWINTASLAGNQRQWAFSLGDGTALRTIGFYIHSQGGQRAYAGYADTANDIMIPFGGRFSSWQHVTMTYESTAKELTVYLNKEQQAQATLPGAVGFSGGTVHIGNKHPALGMGGGADHPLEGFVSDVRIYKRALTPEQVQGIY